MSQVHFATAITRADGEKILLFNVRKFRFESIKICCPVTNLTIVVFVIRRQSVSKNGFSKAKVAEQEVLTTDADGSVLIFALEQENGCVNFGSWTATDPAEVSYFEGSKW